MNLPKPTWPKILETLFDVRWLLVVLGVGVLTIVGAALSTTFKTPSNQDATQGYLATSVNRVDYISFTEQPSTLIISGSWYTVEVEAGGTLRVAEPVAFSGTFDGVAFVAHLSNGATMTGQAQNGILTLDVPPPISPQGLFSALTLHLASISAYNEAVQKLEVQT